MRRLDIANTVIAALTLTISLAALYFSLRVEPQVLTFAPITRDERPAKLVDIGAQIEAEIRKPGPHYGGTPAGFCCWNSSLDPVALKLLISNPSNRTASVTKIQIEYEYDYERLRPEEAIWPVDVEPRTPINIPAGESTTIVILAKYGLQLSNEALRDCGKLKTTGAILHCVNYFEITEENKQNGSRRAYSSVVWRATKLIVTSANGSQYELPVPDLTEF
jgi:hypothetical protein